MVIQLLFLAAAGAVTQPPHQGKIVLTGSRAMLEKASVSARACGFRDVTIGGFSVDPRTLALYAEPKSVNETNVGCILPKLKAAGWPPSILK